MHTNPRLGVFHPFFYKKQKKQTLPPEIGIYVYNEQENGMLWGLPLNNKKMQKQRYPTSI